MSYRCRVDEALARALGVEPGGPWVECDKCKTRVHIKLNGMPPSWLFDGKPPRGQNGWRTTKHADGTRTDRCGACA